MALFFVDRRKIIEIPIVEEDTYEKNVVLYCSIGEPRHIAGRNKRLYGVSYPCVAVQKRETWIKGSPKQ